MAGKKQSSQNKRIGSDSTKSRILEWLGGSLISYLLDQVDFEKLIQMILIAFKERKSLISILELYLKDFPLTLEQAIDNLSQNGLQVMTSEMQLFEAEPQYRFCFDGQVVATSPKARQKVKPGEQVIVKYITTPVIEESKRLYEEAEARKTEKEAERKEKLNSVKTCATDCVHKIIHHKSDTKIDITEGEYVDGIEKKECDLQ